jgi:hypothetical protein
MPAAAFSQSCWACRSLRRASFAAMPTGANAYIFAVQYRRLVNPVSGAVALGTLLAAVTLPVVAMIEAGMRLAPASYGLSALLNRR